MKTIKLKTLLSGLGISAGLFFISPASAVTKKENNTIKTIQEKVEQKLKLPDAIKQQIKNEQVEIYFKINGSGNLVWVNAVTQNAALKQFTEEQFKHLTFSELDSTQDYRICLNYKVF